MYIPNTTHTGYNVPRGSGSDDRSSHVCAHCAAQDAGASAAALPRGPPTRPATALASSRSAASTACCVPSSPKGTLGERKVVPQKVAPGSSTRAISATAERGSGRRAGCGVLDVVFKVHGLGFFDFRVWVYGFKGLGLIV